MIQLREFGDSIRLKGSTEETRKSAVKQPKDPRIFEKLTTYAHERLKSSVEVVRVASQASERVVEPLRERIRERERIRGEKRDASELTESRNEPSSQ